MITLSIDVSKIDKSALYEGKKGKYLNLTLLDTQDSQYGHSHMVVQDIGKERREAGEKGPILGNAKTLDFDKPQSGGGKPKGKPAPKEDPFEDGDEPF